MPPAISARARSVVRMTMADMAELADRRPGAFRLENADSDLAPPAHAVKATIEAVGRDRYNSYLPLHGLPELREAIAGVLGPRGAAIMSREEPPAPPKSATKSTESLRVLVAEDNAVNQRLILRLLEKRGHHVTLAGNGREAVDAVARESFDLVFMDVQMPELDGFEATASIRLGERVTGGRLPIIALTAHAMKGDREKCLDGGMDDYLTKPIQPAELEALLERWSVRVQA